MKGRIFLLLLSTALPALAQKGSKDIATANQYYRAGQYDLAEKYYRAALKKEPSSTIAAYNLANALYRQKRYKESLAVLKQVKADPDNKALQAAVHYNTGVNQTKEKDIEASIESYKAALRLNPDDKEARENLQLALRELKQEQQQNQQQRQQRSSMSQSEAQRRLQQLQQKEKQIQQRLQKNSPQQGSAMEKDW